MLVAIAYNKKRKEDIIQDKETYSARELIFYNIKAYYSDFLPKLSLT